MCELVSILLYFTLLYFTLPYLPILLKYLSYSFSPERRESKVKLVGRF